MGILDRFFGKNAETETAQSSEGDAQIPAQDTTDETYFDEVEHDTLSVWDAASIWASNGMDEAYTFGYSESELRNALED